MDCVRFSKLLAAFADSELETRETLEVQEHLDQCETCRRKVVTQQNFQTLLSSPHLKEEAPAHLAQRIQQSLIQESMPRGKVNRLVSWVNLRPALALAASLLLTLIGVGALTLSTRQIPQNQQFMAEAVNDHIRDNLLQTPLVVNSVNHATIRQWLESRLGAAGMVPSLSRQGVTLEGSRICYLFERRAAHVSYLSNDSRVSFFIVTDDGVRLPNDRVEDHRGTRLHLGSLKGYNAVCWKKAGMAYAFVANSTDVPQDELLRMAKEALEPPESI